jgi:DNA-binding MarR family transcriptional regulator
MGVDGVLELDNFVPYRLFVAAMVVADVIARTYASQFDLDLPQWRVVAVLAGQGEMTQQDIANRAMLPRMAVSRAVRSLADKGLVVRAPNSDDARTLRVTLSAEGVDLFKRLTPLALAMEKRILAGRTAEEVKRLKTFLADIQVHAGGLAREQAYSKGEVGPRRAAAHTPPIRRRGG